MPTLNTNMQGKICMVTGANSGIGKATAMGLASMGATVVMVCRDRTKGEEARRLAGTGVTVNCLHPGAGELRAATVMSVRPAEHTE